MAYALGKKISLPVVNFDMSVGHALCECNSPAKLALMNAIDELYDISNVNPSNINKTSGEETIDQDNGKLLYVIY